jgi:hypothetical protein
MNSLSKFAVFLFGGALVLVGLFVFFSGSVALPTRAPPRQFHFNGLALFLLGLSPLVAGLLSIAIARGLAQRESRATQLFIVVSIAALGLAFALAHKA